PAAASARRARATGSPATASGTLPARGRRGWWSDGAASSSGDYRLLVKAGIEQTVQRQGLLDRADLQLERLHFSGGRDDPTRVVVEPAGRRGQGLLHGLQRDEALAQRILNGRCRPFRRLLQQLGGAHGEIDEALGDERVLLYEA